jgi:hypothetical protein
MERTAKADFATSRSFEFALALAESVTSPTFLAIGHPRLPEHVGLRVGNRCADVRGLLSEAEFTVGHEGKQLTELSREDVVFHCGLSGVPPPYRGSKDMAAARRAVRKAFPAGIPPGAEEGRWLQAAGWSNPGGGNGACAR